MYSGYLRQSLMMVFLRGHFFIDGYHTLFKFDLNGDSAGNLLEVCDDKSSKINMNKRKELINYSYNSHKNYICRNLEVVTKALDVHYPIYESIIFLKDFKAGTQLTTLP